jgi:multimeric flavodoxin WrbA
MSPYKILGISGSPRRANTGFLLEEALKSAETLEGIVTERIDLRNLEIKLDVLTRMRMTTPARFTGTPWMKFIRS